MATVALFNADDELLFGLRDEERAWTFVGGHALLGEAIEDCAVRETFEESGFILATADLEFIGEQAGGRDGSVQVYVFKAKVTGQPDAKNDPDHEMVEWRWVDVSGGVPREIATNLHNPKNALLDLLEIKYRSEDLAKSLKHKFMAVAAAGALASAPAFADPNHDTDHTYNEPRISQWSPKGLTEDMHPIAHLESSFGKNLKHVANSKGEYHSAFGAVGMKAVTAHETYLKDKGLQTLYPNLKDQDSFMREFKANPAFYNNVASTHWNQLKRKAGGDLGKTAFAWRWGAGKMASTPREVITSDPYVQAFGVLHQKLSPPPQTLIGIAKSLFDRAVGEWLTKSQKTQRKTWRSRDGIVIPALGNPERSDWNERFASTVAQVFKGELRPVQVKVEELCPINDAVNLDRLDLYTRMAKAESVLPPVVVQRTSNGWNVLDGNHRYQAAANTGMALLDAFELVAPDVLNTKFAQYKLYDTSVDEFNLFVPKIKRTPHGEFYEPVDLDTVKAQLAKLGFHGYRGRSLEPSTFVFFAQPEAARG